MKVYNQSSSGALWELVKPLLAYKDELPIYKEVMDEDKNSVPPSYLLIRRDITDTGKIFGDGTVQYRESECDLILVSHSKGKTLGDLHEQNIERVKAVLDAAGIDYEGHNLGYDDTQKRSEYAWSLRLIYGGLER